MSAAVYIASASHSRADEIAVSGKYMMLHIDSVSTIGEDHGLKRLDEFVSQTVDELVEYLDQSTLPREQVEARYPEQWYDPSEGLDLINKYIALIEYYHSLSESSKKACLDDLEAYRRILEILARDNTRCVAAPLD